MWSNSAGVTSSDPPAAGNNSDLGSGGPGPGTATVADDLSKDGDPVDAPSATDGSNGEYLLFELHTFPIYKPGDPEYEDWIDGWDRRENSAREDPVPDSKPSRPSWVPWGACDRWIPPYPGTTYETFVTSDGGPARHMFSDGYRGD
eukprot:scaffold26892_cov36-Cyclotella_meneghiniana.AAC.1